MPAPIVYELDLRDLLSKKVEQADAHVETLEHSLERTKGILGEIGGMLGTGFAVFEGFEFLKDSLKDFEKAQDALAQLKAGIQSTGGVAGVTLEDMEQQALRFSEAIPRSKAEIMDLQSILLTFPAITKESFEGVTLTIADMAQRLHTGLQETAIQVGKALQDPEKGITALRRVGVNFNEAQTEVIQNLVETGHAAKAQQLILHELSVEFGGSSAEAAKTFSGQMHLLSNEFEEQKEKLGQLIADGLQAMKPEIQSLIEDLGKSIEFIKEHKDQIKELIKVLKIVGEYYIGWKIAAVALRVVQSGWNLIIGESIALTNQEAVATQALTASLDELSVAQEGVATTAGLMSAAQVEATAASATAGAWALTGTVTANAGANAAGAATAGAAGLLSKAVLPVALLYIGKEAADLLGELLPKGQNGEQFNWKTALGGSAMEEYLLSLYSKWSLQGHHEVDHPIAQRAEFNGVNGLLQEMGVGQGNNGAILNKYGAFLKHPEAHKPKDVHKVHGNNPININIRIEKLSDIKVETTNINEAYGKIKDHVTKVLTDAINDSQVIAQR